YFAKGFCRREEHCIRGRRRRQRRRNARARGHREAGLSWAFEPPAVRKSVRGPSAIGRARTPSPRRRSELSISQVLIELRGALETAASRIIANRTPRAGTWSRVQ